MPGDLPLHIETTGHLRGTEREPRDEVARVEENERWLKRKRAGDEAKILMNAPVEQLYSNTHAPVET